MTSRLLTFDTVFWYIDPQLAPQLRTNISADVVIIGGGMAGLSAAYAWAQRGCKVVLLEQAFCGAGASGKSSGFITPDSEISLEAFLESSGASAAHELWEFIGTGVEHIRQTIKQHEIECGYTPQDTLVVASSKHGFKEIEKEHQARLRMSYPSTLYTQQTLSETLGSSGFYGGVRYPGTFAINAYRYCQGIKQALLKMGVQIFEDSQALSIQDHTVYTPQGSVTAQNIVTCMDRWTPTLGSLKHDITHLQTFILLSAPVSDSMVQEFFPSGPCLVWDTAIIYTYFRMTSDNRVLIGGGNLLTTYARTEQHNSGMMYNKLARYWQRAFSQARVNFIYQWPGLIGVSRDVRPLAYRHSDKPHIYTIAASAGLPWASALGLYSANVMLDGKSTMDEYFSPDRHFPLPAWSDRVIGTRLTFALSHFMSVYL